MGARVNLMFSKAGSLAELHDRLATNDKGAAIPNLANAMLILACDPNLAGLLGHDDFETDGRLLRSPPAANPHDPDLPGPYPREWGTPDVAAVTAYIQRAYCSGMKFLTVEQAFHAEAARNRYHPVRDWLAGLRWDGTARLDTWMAAVFGAPDTAYVKAVSAKTLIAAVRRVRQPGCKFDTMPVLEGGQGIGKSRCVRRLFGPWFTDTMPPDLKSKDGSQALLGAWGIEFAEIEHLIRQEVETIKAFLSRPVERYRPSYGRGFVKRPRQCVFIGTTNSTDYLRDPTGNRRIWPVPCTKADEGWLLANRVQLWAEAADREAAGEALWIEAADAQAGAAAAQDERVSEDVWTTRILDWLAERGPFAVTVPAILSGPLSIEPARQGKREEMRVAAILTRAGWTRALKREGKKPVRLWEPPPDPGDAP